MYPVTFQWSGEAMIPLNGRLADRQYVVGETYRLAPVEERSPASHSHYFAAVHDAWQSLPAEMMDRFPTAEHLRKWALIKSGWRDERSVVAASKAEAQRLAAFIKPLDDFAVVIASECVVTVYTAKSQSHAAMGKQAFQKSKDDVLRVISEMIGVTAETLRQNAGKAA